MIQVQPDAATDAGTSERMRPAYRIAIPAAFAVNLLAFGYLFFTDIYTNHTFPNVYSFDFPSYRTVLEGRWTADFLYLLQGGRGIPLLNLMIAVPLQILNGVLFARVLHVRDPLSIFAAASLISAHPIISDYYGFAGDHIALTLGDTLILLAFIQTQRLEGSWRAVPIGALLIQFGIAAYQPKIGLAATVWIVILLARAAAWDGTPSMRRTSVRELLVSAAAVGCGAALYLLMLHASQWWMGNPAAESAHSAGRLAMSNASQALSQVWPSLASTWTHFFTADLWTPAFKALPGVLLLAFLVAGLGRVCLLRTASTRQKAAAALMFAAAVLLLPFAMHAPFLVSPQGYWTSGRMLTPIVYTTAFLPLALLAMTARRALRWPVLLAVAFMCYRCVIVNAEMGHLASLRTTYEFHFVNRLAARIEQAAPAGEADRYAMVVFGRPPLPDFMNPSAVSYSNLSARGFVDYREAEMVNFLLGRPLLTLPNEAQVERARAHARQQPVWPADGSVSLLDDGTIVVVLEHPYEGVSVTMSQSELH